MHIKYSYIYLINSLIYFILNNLYLNMFIYINTNIFKMTILEHGIVENLDEKSVS